MNSTFDRSHVNNILSERLENYMKELAQDVSVTESNIHDKTLLKPAIAAKWARYSYEEEKYKKVLENKLLNLKNNENKELFEKQKNAIANQTASSDFLSKCKATNDFKHSQTYAAAKKILEEQDDILRFMLEAKQIISQMSFDIKNAIDVLKLENI